jgi:hypothetical protein
MVPLGIRVDTLGVLAKIHINEMQRSDHTFLTFGIKV